MFFLYFSQYLYNRATSNNANSTRIILYFLIDTMTFCLSQPFVIMRITAKGPFFWVAFRTVDPDRPTNVWCALFQCFIARFEPIFCISTITRPPRKFLVIFYGLLLRCSHKSSWICNRVIYCIKLCLQKIYHHNVILK